MEELQKAFNVSKEELLEFKKKEIIAEINHILDPDNYRVTDFNIYIGYYDFDGFNRSERLTDDNNYGSKNLTDINGNHIDGASLVDRVISYYEKLDYNMTTAVVIEYDQIPLYSSGKEIYSEEYRLEYNGYELLLCW